MFDLNAATQAHYVSSAVAALDTFPSRVGSPVFFQGSDLLGAAKLFVKGLGHFSLLKVKKKLMSALLVVSSMVVSLSLIEEPKRIICLI
jgi:hypothetical protein